MIRIDLQAAILALEPALRLAPEGIQRLREGAVAECEEPGDPEVHPGAWFSRRGRIGDFPLHLHGYVPVRSVPGDGHVLGRSLDLAASVEPEPPELGQEYVPVLDTKSLRKPEGIVLVFFFLNLGYPGSLPSE